MTELERRILARVAAVPEGFVATYGDLSPGAPRAAGRALAECGDPAIPWQRIVRADGSLTQGDRQRRLLEREGVPFRGDRVDIEEARFPAEALDEIALKGGSDPGGDGDPADAQPESPSAPARGPGPR